MSHTSPDSRVPAPAPPSKLLDESCALACAPVSKLRSAPATGHAAFGCELAPLLAFARDPLLGTAPDLASLAASRGPPAPAAGSCAELGARGPPWAAAAAGLPAGATAGASAAAPAPGGGAEASAGAGLTRSRDGRPGGRQGSAGSANACVRSTQAGASGSSDSRTSTGVPSGSRRQRRPSATTCAACEARHGATARAALGGRRLRWPAVVETGSAARPIAAAPAPGRTRVGAVACGTEQCQGQPLSMNRDSPACAGHAVSRAERGRAASRAAASARPRPAARTELGLTARASVLPDQQACAVTSTSNTWGRSGESPRLDGDRALAVDPAPHAPCRALRQRRAQLQAQEGDGLGRQRAARQRRLAQAHARQVHEPEPRDRLGGRHARHEDWNADRQRVRVQDWLARAPAQRPGRERARAGLGWEPTARGCCAARGCRDAGRRASSASSLAPAQLACQ